MDTSVVTSNNVGNVIDIVPYETLSDEIKSLVDNEEVKFFEMQDCDIMQYGWDIQATKNDILNGIISDFTTLSVEDIGGILEDIMNSGKSVTPRKRSLFVREYTPTTEDKRKFVGKVGELEDAIKLQISRILQNNENYIKLIHECKNIIDRYAISIMAIDKYLADTSDTFLEDVLAKKKVSLANSRMANVQSAVMYMKLYQNNGLLVNQLYEIINVNLHQLQEQVLVQTEIDGIKKALSECKGIKDSIYNLTENNVKELNSTGTMLLAENEGITDNQDTEKLMKEMVEGLKVLSSRRVKDSQQEEEIHEGVSSNDEDSYTKIVDCEPKAEDFSIVEYRCSPFVFVLIGASKLSLDDKFMKYKPKTENEKRFKEALSDVINSGIKDFYKPKYDPSFVEDSEVFCYDIWKQPAVGKSYNWWAKNAREFYPARKSRLGTKSEYIAFLGVIIKNLVVDGLKVSDAWFYVCNDSKELGHYRNSDNAEHDFEPTGSREVVGFYDLGNTCKILAEDKEAGGYWLAGGDYDLDSLDFPLADLYHGKCRDCDSNYSVGWLVLEK